MLACSPATVRTFHGRENLSQTAGIQASLEYCGVDHAVKMPFLQVLLEHRKDVKLESVIASKDFLAVFHRTNGLQVRLRCP